MHTRYRVEVLLVLAVTFGASGLRAALRLVDSLLQAPLNQQSTTLYSQASSIGWLDVALQAVSALSLIGWGGLAWYLLGTTWVAPKWRDWLRGAGFAALIGIPGLALYIGAVHFGWSKVVIPTTEAVQIPTSLLWAFANGFAEEVVVVMYLCTRLRQMRWSAPATIAASAVLRGSYHLYQGVSAGFGNLAMGAIFAYYYHRTGKVWPLILAHFLIDAVAFLAYPLLPSTLLP